MNEFRLFSKSKYLLKYLNDYILVHIPSNYRVYKEGIEKYAIDLNYYILKANINEGSIRTKYQKEILVSISMIDLYLDIILSYNIISKKKFMTVINVLSELKKMTVSWMGDKENNCHSDGIVKK